jgi:hypothetical protein
MFLNFNFTIYFIQLAKTLEKLIKSIILKRTFILGIRHTNSFAFAAARIIVQRQTLVEKINPRNMMKCATNLPRLNLGSTSISFLF